MKNTITLFIFFCLSFVQKSHCCINEYRAKLNGKIEFTEAYDATPRGKLDAFSKNYLYKKLRIADSLYRDSNSMENYNDFGVALLYVGQYENAKAVFIDIESKSPGLYATASNLGTTYELLGKNDSAYFWIKRGIEIDPTSHAGSEWIHLKILEAKVKANGDESYLWKSNILGLDFGDGEEPIYKNNIDINVLDVQLHFQLNERMSFIKPKDPIIAQLLFDLGNARAITKDAKSGMQIFEKAKEYGYSSSIFFKRENHFKNLQLRAEFKTYYVGIAKKHPMFTLIILPLLFLILLIGTFILLAEKGKSTKQEQPIDEASGN